ncbi:MAG: hypothetical protein ACKOED_14205, partial [Aestuariivirga sp.]|uniref:hypothetical protein n=1 Tax=Aestuariivirga sp. TaxID=2650926 RepID=UPI0038D0F2A2
MRSAAFVNGYRKGLPGRRAARVVRFGLAALLCVLLGSCNAPSAMLENPTQVDLTAKTPRKLTNRNEGPALKTKNQGARYEVFPGASAGRRISTILCQLGAGAREYF